MDESAVKGSGASIPKVSDVGRIIVKGYDTELPLDDVERAALRKHFASCGKITDVDISIYLINMILSSSAYIYFLGEGAVEKALQLHGSDVGGWFVSVEAFPFSKHANDMAIVRIEGYDTSLSKVEIQTALSNHFSSYGKIYSIFFFASYAIASIIGEDFADKAPELDGSDMGGYKLTVRVTSKPRISTVHCRRLYRSESFKTPDKSAKKKRTPDKSAKKKRKLSEEATMESTKAISNSAEKQTPDPNGKKADPGKVVSVYYTGKLQKNGKIVDSNVGKSPFKFRLGVGLGQVIKGLDGILVGGKRQLTIPPAMGHGAGHKDSSGRLAGV